MSDPPTYSLSFKESFDQVDEPPYPKTLSCTIGWNYLSRHDDKTLEELDALFSTDTVQGFYNETTKKYINHRTGYDFNKTQIAKKRWGHYYYFGQQQDVVVGMADISITLKEGWNLAGNTSSQAKTLLELKTSIGANATSAKYYDTTTKTWKTANDIVVPSGRAFFVYVSVDTVWAGQGSSYTLNFIEPFDS